MKLISVLILILATIAVPMSLSAKKAATDSIAVLTPQPRLTCQNCENKIKQNIRFEKGVKEIKTSIPDQTVTIRYDYSKTSLPSITRAFSNIGYRVTPKQSDK